MLQARQLINEPQIPIDSVEKSELYESTEYSAVTIDETWQVS